MKIRLLANLLNCDDGIEERESMFGHHEKLKNKVLYLLSVHKGAQSR